MESGVANPVLASAIVSTANGLDAINASGMSPVNARDALVCIREFEVLRRRMDAVQVGLLSAIDEACFYGADGHASAKAMVRHYAKLSSGEAAARDKTRKVLTAMPEVAVAYWVGDIGVDQIRVMGRIYANPRVRNKMRDDQSWFVNRAKRLDYETFTAKALNWARLADDDGPDPKAERTHERRDTKFSQDFDTSWTLIGGFAAGQGASMYEIFEHYVEAETLADWEKARAEHGDLATYTDLPRSIQQRRADALWQLFHDAAASPHGAMPPSYVHNIVWDHTTFEEMARRVETGEIEPLDPDIFRCETIDGIGLDPYETFANAMNSRIRRVLIDAKGVVLVAPSALGASLPSRLSALGGRNALASSRKGRPWAQRPVSEASKSGEIAGTRGLTIGPWPSVPAVGNTTVGNKKASPSTETKQATGTSTAPTEPKSPPTNTPMPKPPRPRPKQMRQKPLHQGVSNRVTLRSWQS